jgi:hypothetical protein
VLRDRYRVLDFTVTLEGSDRDVDRHDLRVLVAPAGEALAADGDAAVLEGLDGLLEVSEAAEEHQRFR